MTYRATDLNIYSDLLVGGDIFIFSQSNSSTLQPNDLFVSGNVFVTGDVITVSTASNLTVSGNLYVSYDVLALDTLAMPTPGILPTSNMSLKSIVIAANGGIDQGAPYYFSKVLGSTQFGLLNVPSSILSKISMSTFKGQSTIPTSSIYNDFSSWTFTSCIQSTSGAGPTLSNMLVSY